MESSDVEGEGPRPVGLDDLAILHREIVEGVVQVGHLQSKQEQAIFIYISFAQNIMSIVLLINQRKSHRGRQLIRAFLKKTHTCFVNPHIGGTRAPTPP